MASGLKWSLQSTSVVLMPPPTRTSWAMEELLQPWIHYIPMLPDGSNVDEMVKWMLNHDVDAQRIAERATLFIYDLVYHLEAPSDDLNVKQEIVRRYRALWHKPREVQESPFDVKQLSPVSSITAPFGVY